MDQAIKDKVNPNNIKWEQPFSDIFYLARFIMLKNPFVIISIGERGVGKSLSWKLNAIYTFLNTGGRTVYIRRFKKELKDSKKNFMNDIFVGDPRLNKLKFEMKGDDLLIEGKVAITFIPLSQVLTARSVSYQFVVRIIFDEFLTMGRTLNDLGLDEIELFNDYLDTVFRIRENIQIVLLANAISTTSAYFEMFGFDKPIDVKRKYQNPNPNLVRLHDRVILEIIENKSYREKKKESVLMGILADSKYKRYAIENEFAYEDDHNIIPMKSVKGHLKPLYTIRTNSKDLHILELNRRNNEYIVSDSTIYEDVMVYTFDKELITTGAIYISGGNRVSEMLQTMIAAQRLYYSDMRVKKEFLLNLKKIVRTYF